MDGVGCDGDEVGIGERNTRAGTACICSDVFELILRWTIESAGKCLRCPPEDKSDCDENEEEQQEIKPGGMNVESMLLFSWLLIRRSDLRFEEIEVKKEIFKR